MIELAYKRSYNGKTFLRDDGKKVLHTHAGHVHYKNKLDGEFKELSWDLIWDEVKRGWGFDTHSFHPFLPEYSDGLVEFRDLFQDKDQTVKYRAVCDSVKGELIESDETNPNFDDNQNNKSVLYKDAFGKNKDYLLYFTHSELVKVATVNNPNEQTADVKFRWEIQFPDKNIYRAENKEAVEKIERENLFELIEGNKNKAYKLDISRTKKFDSQKDTLIGNTKLDGKEWFTYLKSFKAWDSKGNTIIVEAQIIKEDGKYYLEKTVPLSFLQTAEGRVFTDTTTSYYSGAGDYEVYKSDSTSWSTTRGASTGQGINGWGASLTMVITGRDGSSKYYVGRGFFPVDTSGLPDEATISDAKLYIKPNSVRNDENDGYDYLVAVQTDQASTSTLATSDYDNCGALDSPTEGSDRIDITGKTADTYYYLTLNATGRGWISKTGYTKLGIRVGHDVENSTPGAGNGKYNWFLIYNSNYTGTDSDPYLEITYTEGGGPNIEVTPTVLSATASIISPTVTAIKNIAITATVLGLVMSNPAPAVSVANDVNIEPTALLNTISIQEPTVTAIKNTNSVISPLSLTAGIQAPSVSGIRNESVEASAVDLTSSIIAPTVLSIKNVSISPTTLSANLSVNSVIISTNKNAVITPDGLTASVNIVSPTIISYADTNISAGVSTVNVSLIVPDVSVQYPIVSKNYILKLGKRNFTLKLPKRSFTLKAKF